ncbi:MAG: HlyD family efflux transporter periplasmic adaptor subunit [Pseudomonadota bacterium]
METKVGPNWNNPAMRQSPMQYQHQQQQHMGPMHQPHNPYSAMHTSMPVPMMPHAPMVQQPFYPPQPAMPQPYGPHTTTRAIPQPAHPSRQLVPGHHGQGNSVPQSVTDEDNQIDHYMARAKMLLLVLVIGIGGWATFYQISGAVIASGKVVVESNIKSVQHLEGGIVREISVKDGQGVSEGEVLVRLDKKRVEDQLTGLSSQANAKEQQLILLRSELEDLKALAQKGLVPRNRVVNQERQLAELEGEYGRLTSDISRFSTDKSRLEVRAPLSGRIHKLAVHTIGGVVAPGQEILQIVPSDAKLVFEANINPTDIDQVNTGQSVKVKLPSFNQRTTPELNATVINVSPDLVKDEQAQAFFYTVRIGLNEGEIERLKGKELVPGMPAEAYIQTDSRTVLSYLMKPFTDQLSRALREE